MRLNKIKYTNFKGLRVFTFQPNGRNIDIFGDNGTGKTTIYDGFLYDLTGKDSQNKADFEIKTLTSNGEPMHNLEHEVEAELEHNGRTFTLCKVFAEKWTKKRGQATSEFTGHETTHFIDGVPKSKKEYEAFIASIIDERTLKLLTNPLYFNDDEALKTKISPAWKVRREILLEICGDISDEDVIASDKALAGLTALLNGRSLEDHRQVIKARQSKINEELKKIPIRVNEVNLGLPDITGLNKTKLEADIPSLREQIKSQEQELARIQSGGEIAEKQKRLREIESEMLDIKNTHRAGIDKQIEEERQTLSAVKTQLGDTQNDITALTRNQKFTGETITVIEGKLKVLREDWKTSNAAEFTFEQSDTCPTCARPLPVEQLQEAREKALADFNLKKSAYLNKINQDGKSLKSDLEALQSSLSEHTEDLKQLNISLAVYQQQITDIQATITDLEKKALAVSESPEYQAKAREFQTIMNEISALIAGTSTEQDTIRSEIDIASVALLAVEKDLRSIEASQQGQNRIAELEDQEKELAKEFEKLEGELFLCDSFVKAKVSLLEEKINSKFKLARFKLFDIQINGGINECCETTFNGVPYSGGLNHAAQINVGLDIINTLSEYYGFQAPIFIDNAEAITKLPEMKCQVIRLVVSEPDKVLRVEISNNEREGVLFE